MKRQSGDMKTQSRNSGSLALGIGGSGVERIDLEYFGVESIGHGNLLAIGREGEKGF